MSLMTLVFFGFLAVALGFTLPQQQVDTGYAPQWADGEVIQITEDLLLVRRPRSPQGRIEGTYIEDGEGKRANIDYRHPINKDLDVYASARRDFSRNDNSGHVGVEWRF